jgi:Zn-dependent M28 family amino/carboxypeptidase
VSRRHALIGSFALALAGCGGEGAEQPVSYEEAMAPALAAITTDGLLAHVQILASDEFEGRGPGTPGEDLTVAYLERELRGLGLQPGNPDGTFVQDVPLVGMRSTGTGSVSVGGQQMPMRYPQDFVAVTRHLQPTVQVEGSELVFVGYGVVAPEYGWDDYKDVDVRGKTIVMLVNDPALPDPADPTALDNSMFNGRAMTYYGRWTYKYEIASEKGAAAAIVVHETGPAGYPWQVVTDSWGAEQFDIRSPNAPPRVQVEGWISDDFARRLFQTAGQDFDALKQQALSKDFRPVPLNGTATFHVNVQSRDVQSKNVLARLQGAVNPDETIVYTAHWDHLGKNDAMPAGADNIFNGALDNATGTGGILELAKAFTSLGTPPDRSILFLLVTAEEKGLLGAKYYAQNPLYPLNRTLANINIDGLNQWGRTSDIVVVGYGNSTLDDLLGEAASAQSRTIVPDPEPEKGFFYRSDHFEFAKQGVPAIYTDNGVAYIGKPEGYGQQKRDEYTANDYHQPSDEVKSDWDLAGAVEDLRLLFRVGYRVSQGETWPEWKPGTEFKARRDAMLGGAN